MQVSIVLNCGSEIKRKIKGDKVVCCDGGFNVCTVTPDVILGDFDSLEKAFEAAKACKGKPTAIIAKSVKGKGVSFMENNVSWHGAAPNDEQFAAAMAELGGKA